MKRNPKNLKRGVSQALRNLGKTPNQVAKKLQSMGITGENGSSDSCPIAVFINRNYNVWNAEVGALRIELTTAPNYGETIVKPPTPVARFIRAFDRDKYTYLDRDMIEADRQEKEDLARDQAAIEAKLYKSK